MRKGVVTLQQTATVMDAAKTLAQNSIGSIIVLHKGEPVGIMTERDIVIKVVAAGKDPGKVKLASVMSAPVKAVGPELGIEECAQIVRDERVKRLPVLNKKGKLVGIISETDIVDVSPALFDIIRERADIERTRFARERVFTGICELCSNYSENLQRADRRLVCEECADAP